MILRQIVPRLRLVKSTTSFVVLLLIGLLIILWKIVLQQESNDLSLVYQNNNVLSTSSSDQLVDSKKAEAATPANYFGRLPPPPFKQTEAEKNKPLLTLLDPETVNRFPPKWCNPAGGGCKCKEAYKFGNSAISQCERSQEKFKSRNLVNISASGWWIADYNPIDLMECPRGTCVGSLHVSGGVKIWNERGKIWNDK